MIQASLGTLRITYLSCVFALTIDSSGHYLQDYESVRVYVSPSLRWNDGLKNDPHSFQEQPKLLTCNVPDMNYSKPAIYLW